MSMIASFSFRKFKWLVATATVCSWLAHPTFAEVRSFDDIQFWVGDGPNRAALVVDWSATPDLSPLAWGYRWSGAATGEQMFRAILESDTSFYARMNGGGPNGVELYGIGYDRDRDGFALSDGTPFVNRLAITGPSDIATAVDADDSYNEGWNSAGFWGYFLASTSPYQVGGSWGFASTGFSQQVLNNGDWNGYAYAPAFVGDAPAVPDAAVPEPGIWMAAWWALACLLTGRSRARA